MKIRITAFFSNFCNLANNLGFEKPKTNNRFDHFLNFYFENSFGENLRNTKTITIERIRKNRERREKGKKNSTPERKKAAESFRKT